VLKAECGVCDLPGMVADRMHVQAQILELRAPHIEQIVAGQKVAYRGGPVVNVVVLISRGCWQTTPPIQRTFERCFSIAGIGSKQVAVAHLREIGADAFNRRLGERNPDPFANDSASSYWAGIQRLSFSSTFSTGRERLKSRSAKFTYGFTGAFWDTVTVFASSGALAVSVSGVFAVSVSAPTNCSVRF